MEGFDFSSEFAGVMRRLESTNPEATAIARTQKAWYKVVDEHVAAHTCAVYVVPETAGGEVVVYVDSQIYATELSLAAEMLRLQLNMELKPVGAESVEDVEVVKKLTFRLSNEKYSRQKRMTYEDMGAVEDDAPGVKELSPQEVAALREKIAAVEDVVLRRAMEQALKGYEISASTSSTRL